MVAAATELAEIEAEIEESAASGDQRRSHPLVPIRALRAAFPRETIVAIDVGCLAQHIAGATPYFKVFEPRSLIVPSSFYGMGFAASALPAARLVHPDRPAVCFVGDGSFQMVMSVLPVAAEYELGVTWCVLNDGALGSIRDIQQYRLGDRYIATTFEMQPDFAAIAAGVRVPWRAGRGSARRAGPLARALDANGAAIPPCSTSIVAARAHARNARALRLLSTGAGRRAAAPRSNA